MQSNLALVEYLGTFPGLAPHGNSKQANSEYLRTPDFVMQEAQELLKSEKPKIVFEQLKKKYDEITRPTGLQQIRDKKKYEIRKGKPLHHKNNVADNIQTLETQVSHNHPYIRSVIRTNSKTPCIILYSDEQI